MELQPDPVNNGFAAIDGENFFQRFHRQASTFYRQVKVKRKNIINSSDTSFSLLKNDQVMILNPVHMQETQGPRMSRRQLNEEKSKIASNIVLAKIE